MMKKPFYIWAGVVGLILFIGFHFVFGWNHPEDGAWHWVHDLAGALLVICGVSYWIEEIIKQAIRKA